MDKKPGIRPRASVWHGLDVASRHAFPSVQTLIVCVLLAAPLGIPEQPQVQSSWSLACVFFWTLYRPSSMSALLVFGTGLLVDCLGQGPMGVNVFLLLLLHACTLKFRRGLVRGGFARVWLTFSGSVAILGAVCWALCAGLMWRLPPVLPAVLDWAMATGLYPFISAYFIVLHRGLAAPERAS